MTVTDLKTVPESYATKPVQLEAFVSSVKDGQVRYVSDEENITNDLDNDIYTDHYLDFEQSPAIYTRSGGLRGS